MTVTYKDIKSVKNQLGQFMTPDAISGKMVSSSDYQGLIIEPSFGLGSFLLKLEEKYNRCIGIEYDKNLYDQYTGKTPVYNMSFYKFKLSPNDLNDVDAITFVGNPPYRTPAVSLKSDDSDCVNHLTKKYKLTGIKEEAVFFIAHAVDLIIESGLKGEIHWVLPTTIFQNSSAAFSNFRKFLNKYAPLVELVDIDEDYPDVSQPLCVARFLIGQPVSEENNITDKFVLRDTIEFQQIFKKTWLGSVPCEGILMSCREESLHDFKKRMEDLFQENTELKTALKYNDTYHLRALTGKASEEKFKILEGYVEEIKQTIPVSDFSDIKRYKKISHRNEVRWYFRHDGLKQVSFIYILNSNPCKGFYFPGNPTKTSTDYFGYCDYDVNRNSSPGANRVVPLDDVIDNITDKFKYYWNANTTEPISMVFDYILHISKSPWYKAYKSKYQRFYFGLPLEFDKSWRSKSNSETPLSWNEIATCSESEIVDIVQSKETNLLETFFEF